MVKLLLLQWRQNFDDLNSYGFSGILSRKVVLCCTIVHARKPLPNT